ncbi:L,D-transpeptidase family protein [Lysobacter arvi]|uniref:L,D-transpeptidase family protein n=1 Tax=Lysobacter arvi TaxID=3038776 RepID=A0ABU1C9W8_9GAMM|nr:L,D-transpeptidase family protein [Lysobacter arvi]MDR0181984.1 L,D-transpeptidase family protein [Lysobacter arvi]
MRFGTAWRAAWVLAALLAAFPIAAQGVKPDTAPLSARSADFVWMEGEVREGPVLVVVSLDAQRAYVYRGAARIAVSNVSTGRPGFETPQGVYTVLEKRREHYSNLYDDAPMPFMQRLTWGGLALHAGALPGRPASHGCIRLPYAFAEKLFGVTSRDTTIVIARAADDPASTASTPISSVSASDAASLPYTWTPDAAHGGPLAIVYSTHDREVVVLRGASEIGRATVDLVGESRPGRHVFWLLSGARTEASVVVPGRPALRWLEISLEPEGGDREIRLADASGAGTIRVNEAFARVVYDILEPGTVLLITDAPLQSMGNAITPSVLSAERTR